MSDLENGFLLDLDCLPDSRIIWLGSEGDKEGVSIDKEMSKKIVLSLMLLDATKDDPITMMINCGGGSLVDSLSIFDAISMCRSNVVAVVVGEASSGASLIMQAADKRIMTPNSSMMIHYGSGSNEGTLDNLKREMVFWESQLLTMVDIYKDKTDMSKKELIGKLKKDTFMDAEESVKLGFADKVITSWEEIKEQ